MIALLRKVYNFYLQRNKETNRQIYASHAAFYLIVSAPSILLLILQIFARFSENEAQNFLSALITHLPVEIADYLPIELFKESVGTSLPLISLTVLALLWSSSKGMRAVISGLHAVYGKETKESALKTYLISLLITLFFLFSVVLALILLVFGRSISLALSRFNSRFLDLSLLLTRLATLSCFSLFTLAFAFLYKFTSAEKTPLRRHLPGALFSSGGFILFSLLLSQYLRLFEDNRYSLYGGMGALLLFMLWVRTCSSILLFGAEVNLCLQKYLRVIKANEEKKGASK